MDQRQTEGVGHVEAALPRQEGQRNASGIDFGCRRLRSHHRVVAATVEVIIGEIIESHRVKTLHRARERFGVLRNWTALSLASGEGFATAQIPNFDALSRAFGFRRTKRLKFRVSPADNPYDPLCSKHPAGEAACFSFRDPGTHSIDKYV
ncbi:hypothetical protein [Pandoraea iniqua]|uniref:hypothetical protein n=1 Tax=Pandoraea iniqua TaxID=2508288 RepID=UPI001581F8F3|nr:hypothetical protein [Pandoraea iniqua]